MGSVLPFSSHSTVEVFTPLIPRPVDTCRVIYLDERSQNLFDAVAAQIALDETARNGYHVVTTPDTDGPVIRYIITNADGTLLLMRHRGDGIYRNYTRDKVRILGRIFQFIRDLNTGERWELIAGTDTEPIRQAATGQPA